MPFEALKMAKGAGSVVLSFALPHHSTGDTPLPITWKELTAQVQGVGDAAASPGGSHVLLLVGGTQSNAAFANGRVAASLARVPVSAQDAIVMLRWATEQQAAEWTRAIPALAEPVVRFRPATVQPPAP